MTIIFYTPNSGGLRGCKLWQSYFAPHQKLHPYWAYRANQPVTGRIAIEFGNCALSNHCL